MKLHLADLKKAACGDQSAEAGWDTPYATLYYRGVKIPQTGFGSLPADDTQRVTVIFHHSRQKRRQPAERGRCGGRMYFSVTLHGWEAPAGVGAVMTSLKHGSAVVASRREGGKLFDELPELLHSHPNLEEAVALTR